MNRWSRWMSWAAACAVGVVALSGCVDGGEPGPSASTTPTSSPSDEPTEVQLLAEAREVYDGFIAASVAMWEEPQVDYTLWLPWADQEIATAEAAGQEALRAEGVASIGPISVAGFLSAGGATGDQVDVFACLDFTLATHLDSHGTDVTPAAAVDFTPLQVRFERGPEGLRVTEQEALPEGVESPCP